MAKPGGNCPNCGAPIEFQFSSDVQTTCPYCRSILVRHDVDLKKVGQVADLPPEISPIQLLTEGTYKNKSFRAIGRIIYQYDEGYWNEWHCVTHQGESLWLSDAMAEYAVSWLANPGQVLPGINGIKRGSKLNLSGVEYEITSVNSANYLGVEGELPFEYWDKERTIFVDLKSYENQFGTIDYSENPPLLFLGEYVDFDSLKLKNLREFEGW